MQILIPRIYYQALSCDKFYLVLYGGAGSGKSYFATQKLIIRCLTEHDAEHVIYAFRKVKDTIATTLFPQFLRVISDMGVTSLFSVRNSSPRSLTCKLNGNKIVFSGLDDREKLKSIPRMTSAFVDEADQPVAEDIDEITVRMRGETKTYKQLLVAFNPTSTQRWVYKRFFLDANDYIIRNSLIIKSTYLDNPFIGSDYEARLRESLAHNPNLYASYVLGEWGQLQEQVYAPFLFSQNNVSYSQAEVNFWGLDFGYNSPLALVRVSLLDGVYHIREFIYRTYMTITELIEEMKRLVDEGEMSYTDEIYADSADAFGAIDSIYQAGFNIHKADKSVAKGIETVRRLHKNIRTHASNKNLNREADGYCYKKDKDGTVLEEVVKSNDHALDAMRYALHSYTVNYKRDETRIYY